jgi:small GTP-binding protein
MISRKILITGSFAVGKTSLFRRLVYNEFSDKYLTTIGVKVDKRELTVNGQDISLVLWDVAGEVSQEKIPRSYFMGASAVIYIYDLTRPRTCDNLQADIDLIQKILPGCMTKIVGNKKDLIEESDLKVFNQKIDTDYFTSAKTGENVSRLFEDIAKGLLTFT